jgi:hypothetical protein
MVCSFALGPFQALLSTTCLLTSDKKNAVSGSYAMLVPWNIFD